MPAAPADYYTGQAAASLLGVSRFTLNEWVELERQAPDALVLTASSSRRPQPAWSAETLQQWSRCTPGSPIQLLSPSAAISYTGLTPTTFNNWRARVEIPADATIHRSSTGTPKPVWTTTTLDLWLHKVSRHTRRRSADQAVTRTPRRSGPGPRRTATKSPTAAASTRPSRTPTTPRLLTDPAPRVSQPRWLIILGGCEMDCQCC